MTTDGGPGPAGLLESAVRTLVVWCPDWPVIAASRDGLADPGAPTVIIRANRVIAASSTAREHGVRRAMRRREAQSRCPEVEVIVDDPGRDARCFEAVAAVLDEYTPRIEVVRAGLCQFPTRGPSRYFGGDVALRDAIRFALADLGVEARIGVADGAFAGALAARAANREGLVIAESTSPEYLAPHPMTALVAVEGGRSVTRAASTVKRSRASASEPADALAIIDLVDLLQRLGIHTLGAFAALPRVDVLSRFGPVGERAWRLASGLDVRPPQTRIPPPDLVVETVFDPPVERVETAAFVAKAMADEFSDRLARHGSACTRVRIDARTDDGVELSRLWRHERAGAAGGLSSQNLADRLRWQLDGWLQRRQRADADLGVDSDERASGSITVLRLVPDEIVPDTGHQLGLWGGTSALDERAARGFARVQGLLGPDSVCTPVLRGGRRPSDLVTLIPWGDQRETPVTADRPWPGRLPSPLPTVVHALPLPCEVLDRRGQPVMVNRRVDMSGEPASIRFESDVFEVESWAGPWPLDERWWDLQNARRQIRLQLVAVTRECRRAFLAVLEDGSWWIEAEYR